MPELKSCCQVAAARYGETAAGATQLEVFLTGTENARWTPVAPFPRPVFQVYSELRFVEADIGFLAGTPR